MEDNELKNQISMRKFLNGKYTFELLTLTVILAAIFLFRMYDFIEGSVTGTLLGTTIAYFASSIRKLHERNEK